MLRSTFLKYLSIKNKLENFEEGNKKTKLIKFYFFKI